MDHERCVNVARSYLPPYTYHPPATLEGLASSTAYPNRNSIEYKLMDTVKQLLPQPYPYTDFLTVNQFGTVVMAANKYPYRVWGSGIYGWESVADIPRTDKRIFFRRRRYIITALCYTKPDDTRFFLGNDKGSIEMWWSTNTCGTSDYFIRQMCSRSEHIAGITALSVDGGQKQLISGSTEGCLKVWNYDVVIDQQPTRTLDHAHTRAITGLSFDGFYPSMALSCSRDSSSVLWDFRKAQPAATVLYEKHNAAFTTIQWAHTVNMSQLVVMGDEAGKMHFIDIRQPKIFFESVECFDRKIRKMSFHRGHIAVLGNTSEVKFFDLQCNLTYVENSAPNFVRDIVWHEQCTDETISCSLFGWESYCKRLDETIVRD